LNMKEGDWGAWGAKNIPKGLENFECASEGKNTEAGLKPKKLVST